MKTCCDKNSISSFHTKNFTTLQILEIQTTQIVLLHTFNFRDTYVKINLSKINSCLNYIHVRIVATDFDKIFKNVWIQVKKNTLPVFLSRHELQNYYDSCFQSNPIHPQEK